MSRIAVIGGTGYAGSAIVREAASRGHEVVSFSRSVPAEEARVDGVDEGVQQVEAGSDAVADDQRWTGSGARAHRDAHLVAEDGDPADAGVHQVNAPTPVMSRPTMRVWMVSVPS